MPGLSRSAWYSGPGDRLARDGEVIDALQAVVEKHPRWGFWKCFDRLRLDGQPWNHKRVYRVYKELGLNHKRRTKKRLPRRERVPLEVPARPNAVWSVDFMHDTLYVGRRFRTFNVIDEGVREVLGHRGRHVADRCADGAGDGAAEGMVRPARGDPLRQWP